MLDCKFAAATDWRTIVTFSFPRKNENPGLTTHRSVWASGRSLDSTSGNTRQHVEIGHHIKHALRQSAELFDAAEFEWVGFHLHVSL